MHYYKLNLSQFIHQSIEQVFAFFSRPANLDQITPQYLNFKIETFLPIKMKRGQKIDYTITLKGIPIRWSSLISLYDPPNSFVDEQIRGPFSLWHHTHNFREKNDGTVIGDHVRYAIPMGIIGRMANNVFVEKDLRHIFGYRQKMISKLFPKYH